MWLGQSSEPSDGIYKLSLSPDGKLLAAIHYSSILSIWHVPSLRLKRSWQLGLQVVWYIHLYLPEDKAKCRLVHRNGKIIKEERNMMQYTLSNLFSILLTSVCLSYCRKFVVFFRNFWFFFAWHLANQNKRYSVIVCFVMFCNTYCNQFSYGMRMLEFMLVCLARFQCRKPRYCGESKAAKSNERYSLFWYFVYGLFCCCELFALSVIYFVLYVL